MHRFLLFLFTLYPIYLFSQLTTQWYDAEEYSLAAEKFHAAALNAEQPDDRVLFQYYEAMSYLSDGEYQKSVGIFRALLTNSSLFPLRFKRDLYLAYLYALISWAEVIASDNTNLAQGLIWEAEENYTVLQQIECQLQAAKGAKNCSTKFDGIRQWLQENNTRVSETLSQQFVVPVNLEEGLWRSELAWVAFQEQLNVLGTIENPSIKQAYLNAYLSTLHSLNPLFGRMGKLAPPKLASSLEQAYLKYIGALNEGTLEQAQTALDEGKSALELISNYLYSSEDSSKDILYILAIYDNVLRGKTISISMLGLLLDRLERYHLDDKNALSAQEYAKRGYDTIARLYLETGRRKLERTLKVQGVPTPLQILEYSIIELEHTIKLRRLLLNMPIERKAEISILEDEQKLIRNWAKPFLASVIKVQEEGFANGKCQHFPWADILPSFHEGWNSEEASEYFTKRDEALALNAQEKALQAWNRTAALLKKPPHHDQQGCYAEKPKPSSGNNEEEKKAPKPEKIENVLRQVQQMEQDDRLEKKQNVIRKGEKPW